MTLIVGFVTPPFGANLFSVVGLTKLPFAEVVKGVIPFLCAAIIVLLLMVIFPQISLLIPSLITAAA